MGKICSVASLVPVGNRIYHQGGSGCRSHRSCLDGIEPDARLNSVGIVVGSQLFVFISLPLWYRLATVSTTRGAECRTHLSCFVAIKPVARPYKACAQGGVSLGDSDPL